MPLFWVTSSNTTSNWDETSKNFKLWFNETIVLGLWQALQFVLSLQCKEFSGRSHTLWPAELQRKGFKFQPQTGEINSRATWEAHSLKVAFLSAGTGLCQPDWHVSPVAWAVSLEGPLWFTRNISRAFKVSEVVVVSHWTAANKSLYNTGASKHFLAHNVRAKDLR